MAACKDFERIFPSTLSYTYFQFFDQVLTFLPSLPSLIQLSYYDKLLDAAEHLVVAQGRPFLNKEVISLNLLLE